MPWVLFPPQLCAEFPELGDAQFGGTSLREVFECIEAAHPGLGERFLTAEGALRERWMVLVSGRLLEDRQGLADAVDDADDVYILGRPESGASGA